jgi:3'(2'), 5'-bisphosphate nucleotidase
VGGAWREENGGPAERIYSREATPGSPLTVVETLSHPSAELQEYLQTIPVARRVKARSSLKFCWVAEGRADIYPRLGPTMEWDVAAGNCVYRQSGRNGERPSPLTYNKLDSATPASSSVSETDRRTGIALALGPVEEARSTLIV